MVHVREWGDKETRTSHVIYILSTSCSSMKPGLDFQQSSEGFEGTLAVLDNQRQTRNLARVRLKIELIDSHIDSASSRIQN